MFNKLTLMVAVVAFALGLGAGWLVFTDSATPCWEVQAELRNTSDEAVASLGKEGHGAMREAAADAADRPDCFSPTDRRMIRQMAETPQPPLPDATPGEVTVEPTESSTTAG